VTENQKMLHQCIETTEISRRHCSFYSHINMWTFLRATATTANEGIEYSYP